MNVSSTDQSRTGNYVSTSPTTDPGPSSIAGNPPSDCNERVCVVDNNPMEGVIVPGNSNDAFYALLPADFCSPGQDIESRAQEEQT